MYSKVLLSNERQKNGPAELQFNTSLASFVIQLIASFAFIDWSSIKLSSYMIGAILINGLFFHFQSITEYALLEHITPVTHRYIPIIFSFYLYSRKIFPTKHLSINKLRLKKRWIQLIFIEIDLYILDLI